MAGLNEQLEGVERVSPPEPEADEPVEEVVEESVEPEGETKEEPKGEVDEKDRPVENVRREFARKFEKQEEDSRKFQESLLDRMADMTKQFTETLGAVKQPAAQTKTLEDYSIAELTAHRDSMEQTDPQRAQLDTIIARKYVNDEVDRKVDEVATKQRIDIERKSAGDQAVQRYPDLNDESSEFWQKVDRKLRGMSHTAKANNPRIVLDVANEVALSDGVPAKTVRTVRAPGRPGANKRDGIKPAPQAKDEYLMSLDEAKKLAKTFERAHGKPFTAEQIDKIRKKHREFSEYYKGNASLMK